MTWIFSRTFQKIDAAWEIKEVKTKLFTYIQDIPKYIHFHKNIKVITKMS